jgi:hypothetical protein
LESLHGSVASSLATILYHRNRDKSHKLYNTRHIYSIYPCAGVAGMLLNNLFSTWYSWKIAHLKININHALAWFLIDYIFICLVNVFCDSEWVFLYAQTELFHSRAGFIIRMKQTSYSSFSRKTYRILLTRSFNFKSRYIDDVF